MARMFGPQVYQEFTGVGATQSWIRARYALGEAAFFTRASCMSITYRPVGSRGKVHFAGEHTSLKPAWIEGSLESAVRTAVEVNQR